jgi:hypothetical protein
VNSRLTVVLPAAVVAVLFVDVIATLARSRAVVDTTINPNTLAHFR